jgi:3-hydroxy-4-methylanthranilate adenylyltransferase
VAGGASPQVAGSAYPQLEPEWVDEVLLAGPADDVCLHLDSLVSRAGLRRLVARLDHRLALAARADAGRQAAVSYHRPLP